LIEKDPSRTVRGLPIAIKDVIATKGVRTTWGSLVHKDHVPAEDHIMAERLKAAGAILIGKTNTPEFGAGSQTFNKVFGATRNPYDLSKTCGGSSGGAAWRWPAACCRSPTAATSPRRCATRATTAT
jgi:amidase